MGLASPVLLLLAVCSGAAIFQQEEEMSAQSTSTLQDTFLKHIRDQRVEVTIFFGEWDQAPGPDQIVRQFHSPACPRQWHTGRLQACHLDHRPSGAHPTVGPNFVRVNQPFPDPVEGVAQVRMRKYAFTQRTLSGFSRNLYSGRAMSIR
jgi:hypothetical protein